MISFLIYAIWSIIILYICNNLSAIIALAVRPDMTKYDLQLAFFSFVHKDVSYRGRQNNVQTHSYNGIDKLLKNRSLCMKMKGLDWMLSCNTEQPSALPSLKCKIIFTHQWNFSIVKQSVVSSNNTLPSVDGSK